MKIIQKELQVLEEMVEVEVLRMRATMAAQDSARGTFSKLADSLTAAASASQSSEKRSATEGDNVSAGGELEMLRTHRQEIVRLKSMLRAARVAAAAGHERGLVAARNELLGYSDRDRDENEAKKRRKDRAAVARSVRSINAGMLRTRQLMASSLERGANALDLLASSSGTIADVGNVYSQYDAGVDEAFASTRRITERASTDRLLISLAFLVFCASVLFVLHQRLGVLTPAMLFLRPLWQTVFPAASEPASSAADAVGVGAGAGAGALEVDLLDEHGGPR